MISVLMCTCLVTFGCASTADPVVEYRTTIEYRDRPVPVDARLTADIPPPDFEAVTWLEGTILGIHYRQKYESYRERMRIIRETHSSLPGSPPWLLARPSSPLN